MISCDVCGKSARYRFKFETPRFRNKLPGVQVRGGACDRDRRRVYRNLEITFRKMIRIFHEPILRKEKREGAQAPRANAAS